MLDEAIDTDQSVALMGQMCGTVVTQVSIATDWWHYKSIGTNAKSHDSCYFCFTMHRSGHLLWCMLIKMPGEE